MEPFNHRILSSKIIKFYDIHEIDYLYIEELFQQNIPQHIIDIKQGHERMEVLKNGKQGHINEHVYDVDMDEYIMYDIEIPYFYNEDIQKKIYDFYKKDFEFFKKYGVQYELMNHEK